MDTDYEFECERAELLGVAPPTREEFLAQQRTREIENEENVQPDQLEEIDLQGEAIGRTGGKLDELNNILSSTQKKINRFKTVCGSFSSLLKLKIGVQQANESDTTSQHSVNVEQPQDNGVLSTPVKPKVSQNMRSTDVRTQVGSQIDKLDSVLMKTERAEMSMQSQNKQMRQALQ